MLFVHGTHVHVIDAAITEVQQDRVLPGPTM